MYEWYPDKGNPVTPVPMGTVGDGPAAVIGDETCDKPLPEALSLSKGKGGKAQEVGRSESQKT